MKAAGKQGNNLPPGITALRETREQKHSLSVFTACAEVVQPLRVNVNKVVLVEWIYTHKTSG
jgi:hypothetical protein